jgi:hypothetical protein
MDRPVKPALHGWWNHQQGIMDGTLDPLEAV